MQTALVTGGSKGIGLEIVSDLLQGVGLDSDLMPLHKPKRSKYLLMKPGQFYIFSNFLLHRSHITNGNIDRKVLVMRFADKNVILKQPHYHVMEPLYSLRGSQFVQME